MGPICFLFQKWLFIQNADFQGNPGSHTKIAIAHSFWGQLTSNLLYMKAKTYIFVIHDHLWAKPLTLGSKIQLKVKKLRFQGAKIFQQSDFEGL